MRFPPSVVSYRYTLQSQEATRSLSERGEKVTAEMASDGGEDSSNCALILATGRRLCDRFTGTATQYVVDGFWKWLHMSWVRTAHKEVASTYPLR